MNKEVSIIKSAVSRKAGRVPFRSSKALADFLNQPKIKIAEAITGALSVGRQEAIQIGARLVQGALKGHFMTQLGREIRSLIEKGEIREDYAETKFGFQSLAELLDFIDRETIDEDRFTAIKAMFFALNSIGATEGEQIVNYQLFRLSKQLSSSQLLMLKISYDLHKERAFPDPNANFGGEQWINVIAKRIGHEVITLLKQDESVLMEHGLLSQRVYGDKSGVQVVNARLTDLGLKFCEHIEKYQRIDVSQS